MAGDDDDTTTAPPALVRLREVLDGTVPDGTHVVVHGTVDTVTVSTYPQTGRWAMGRVVDADDSVRFWMFARAFARTGRVCVEADGPIAVTACVSFSTELPVLVINSIERIERIDSRIEPDLEPGVDGAAV